VQHREDHRHGELQVEPDRDVEDDEEQREQHGDDRRLRDLPTEARRDGRRTRRGRL
jgi:hypothetical protein